MRFVSIILLAAFAAVTLNAQPPAEIERRMLKHLKDISASGNYMGSYDDARSTAANRAMRNELVRNGSRLAVLKYGFPKLKDQMFVATSPDGKFRIYSWDTETGGTMHEYASVFQYRGKSGKVYTWSDSDEEDSGGPFYSEVFQVTGRSGPIYLAVSTFIASTSLSGQAINAMRIVGDRLDRKVRAIRTDSGLTNTVGFEYDFFSVVDHPERPVKLFFFDQAKREFRFPVVIEDEKTPQGRVTDKFITYRFDGTVFRRVN